MADPNPNHGRGRDRLDALGRREVVFCHQCDNEWWKDDHGLACPRCQSEATEIVSPGNDPRSVPDAADGPDGPTRLRDHDPWVDEDVPDPEEGDIEQFLHRGGSGNGNGNTTFFSSSLTTSGLGAAYRIHRVTPADHGDPSHIIHDFQTMVGNFMVPGVQQGQAGRSGPEALFRHGEAEPLRRNPFTGGVMGEVPPDRPQIAGHRFTMTARRPRDPNGQEPGDDGLATILGSLFGPEGPVQVEVDGTRQVGALPPGLSNFFATVLNPRNAVAGDAVYSQEAFDRILSNLMDQHPPSNAPGPATPEAIANLPKRRLDETMLGPEHKGECSVCMEDVTVGDEVVVLPCKHWFHEACARAWLSEHNTCPICRAGISGDSNAPPLRRASYPGPSTSSHQDNAEQVRDRERSRLRHLARHPPPPISEIRRNSTRDRSSYALSPTLPVGSSYMGGPGHGSSSSGSRYQYQIIGDPERNRNRTPSPPIPRPPYSPQFRRRESISEGQRESRRNTSSEQSRRRSVHMGHTGESVGSGGGFTGWIRRLGRSGESSGSGSGSGHSYLRRD